MVSLIQSLRQKLIKNQRTLPFLFLLLIFILNTFYVSYPDEFVNLLGGKAILQGKIPYKEFFDHHMPGAWSLSALLLALSNHSFVLFRILWALFQFLILLYVGLKIKRENKELFKYFMIFLIFYPLSSFFLWAHLFLADSLATLFSTSIFWLLINETLKDKPSRRNLLITNFFVFLLIFSSLTFIYLAGIFYLWSGLLFLKTKAKRKDWLKAIGLTLLPYLLYLLYLLLSGSLKDFWFSNFTYNTKLYISIPNYKMGRYFNPFKMALTLIFNFWNSFLPASVRIGSLDIYFPFIQMITLSTLIFLVLWFLKDRLFFLLFFFLFSFSAPRSNIENIGVSDYQSAVFSLLGVSALFISLYLFNNLKKDLKSEILSLSLKAATLLLIYYSFFSFLFLAKEDYEKLFYIYIQKMPRIYDFDSAANFVDEIIEPNDYFWIGPYEPHRSFFVKKGKLPGKYPTLLPQFSESEYLKKDFIAQFEKNPPKIILFKNDASIFMTPVSKFGEFFFEYLKNDYIRLSEVKNIQVKKNPNEFNLETDLYINKKDIKDVLKKLEKKGYITKQG